MAFKKDEDEIIPKSRDEKVVFDERTHTYYYNDKILISTTQFIKSFSKPFNSLFPSINKAKKNSQEKVGITDAKKLRLYWKLSGERASNLGTASHIFAQLYMLDRNTIPKNGYEKAIVKAIDKIEEKWEIISQEEIVYSQEYLIAGSIDLILRNKKTGEYAVGDWKTTEDMEKSYNKMDAPFSFEDKPLNKYSIQLDIYSLLAPYYVPESNRIIIKLTYDGKFFFYTTKSKGEYKIPYTMDKSKKALDIHKKQIKH